MNGVDFFFSLIVNSLNFKTLLNFIFLKRFPNKHDKWTFFGCKYYTFTLAAAFEGKYAVFYGTNVLKDTIHILNTLKRLYMLNKPGDLKSSKSLNCGKILKHSSKLFLPN